MQRYFTLQLFECFDIPIDDLWAEIDVPDGMRMRRRMHSFFCRHSILRITLAVRRTNASLPLCGLCTRQCKHDCSEMAEAVTWVSDYSSLFPHPSLKMADFIAYS